MIKPPLETSGALLKCFPLGNLFHFRRGLLKTVKKQTKVNFFVLRVSDSYNKNTKTVSFESPKVLKCQPVYYYSPAFISTSWFRHIRLVSKHIPFFFVNKLFKIVEGLSTIK